ncbi:roadblock/LC7 domain-containing protein (plasmid) [Embleya sp. NBC_00888]|uniref:roadblock/LC7 domain-containing protein n=1 Tax=Embleya sp. NBC_00888 TaxID=2975960 RepID=UPI002F910BB6|nr:roadblock/LC7 domain-containing protein [Embleya sp. NBC_00888]
MTQQPTTTSDLNWLVEKCVDEIHGVRGIVVFSDDGIRTAWHTPTVALAEQLAAAGTGLRSLGAGIGALAELGPVVKQFVEFTDGYVFLISAGRHAHATVLADRRVDPGIVTGHLHKLLTDIRASLDARTPTSNTPIAAHSTEHAATLPAARRSRPQAGHESGRDPADGGGGVR